MPRCSSLVAAALVPFLLAAHSEASSARQPRQERTTLSIPDSVVIEGRVRYRLYTSGAKEPTYYGRALPVERRDTPYGYASITTLSALSSKSTYPIPVRHGAIRATQARLVAQHYGNVLARVNQVADLRGWLFSGGGEFGGGRGHTSGAGWHREALSGRVRKVISWRTAHDMQVAVENGRTGMWGVADPSHRTYYRLAGGLGIEQVLGDDHEVRLDAKFAQRGVGSRETNASEQAFFSRLTWQRASGRFWVSASADADVVHTSRLLGTSGTGSHFTISGQAWTRPEENFGGALGVTIYTVDYLAGDSLQAIRPSIAVWARLLTRLKLTAALSSGVDRMGVWEAYKENPFLSVATPIRRPFRSVDIDVKADVSLTPSSSAMFGLKHVVVADYAVWVRKESESAWNARFPNEPFARDQFVVDYGYAGDESASISSFYGRYHYFWSRGSVDALGIWRVHGLKGRGVPHVPDWEAHLVANFPIRNGFVVEPAARLVGPRTFINPRSLDALDRLGSYVLLDVQMEAPLRSGWMLTASLRNLLNQSYERWEGYREPGLHLQVGVKRAW